MLYIYIYIYIYIYTHNIVICDDAVLVYLWKLDNSI